MLRRGQVGLTLVEMLIAIALLGFVLLGIAPLFIASVKSNYSANEYTTLNTIARDRLEQLMNRPFNDVQLDVGFHGNDQNQFLPDPITGIPPAPPGPGVRNPFTITYQVTQWAIPRTVGPLPTPPPMTPFNPTRVTVAVQPFSYKRIDVTVTSATGPIGIGTRMARVTGCLSNPAPASEPGACFAPGIICSAVDGCPIPATGPC